MHINAMQSIRVSTRRMAVLNVKAETFNQLFSLMLRSKCSIKVKLAVIKQKPSHDLNLIEYVYNELNTDYTPGLTSVARVMEFCNSKGELNLKWDDWQAFEVRLLNNETDAAIQFK